MHMVMRYRAHYHPAHPACTELCDYLPTRQKHVPLLLLILLVCSIMVCTFHICTNTQDYMFLPPHTGAQLQVHIYVSLNLSVRIKFMQYHCRDSMRPVEQHMQKTFLLTSVVWVHSRSGLSAPFLLPTCLYHMHTGLQLVYSPDVQPCSNLEQNSQAPEPEVELAVFPKVLVAVQRTLVDQMGLLPSMTCHAPERQFSCA